MLLAAILLIGAPAGAGADRPVAPPHGRSHAVCRGVDVTAPNLARQPRNLVFSSREVLDLRLEAGLKRSLVGDHVLRLKVFTPGGFLYQVLTVPFAGATPPPRRKGSRLQDGHHDSDEPPTRFVPGYPRPLPVRRLRPVGRDPWNPSHYGVEALLPVAGTSITLSSLYGRWTVQPYLDDEPEPCGPAQRFTIRD